MHAVASNLPTTQQPHRPPGTQGRAFPGVVFLPLGQKRPANTPANALPNLNYHNGRNISDGPKTDRKRTKCKKTRTSTREPPTGLQVCGHRSPLAAKAGGAAAAEAGAAAAARVSSFAARVRAGECCGDKADPRESAARLQQKRRSLLSGRACARARSVAAAGVARRALSRGALQSSRAITV
jgi:hypothetical protein